MHDLTETKTGNLTTWAADINAAHHAAMGHAADAVAYAKQAGALLVKAKQKLPHGVFGAWLDANCEVSARQAQRYMAAAQGKPLPVRAIAAPVKNDTVSHLPAPAPSEKEDAKALEEARGLVAHLQYALLMSKVRLLPVEDRAAAYETIELARQLEYEVQQVTRERDLLMNETAEMKRVLKRQRREIEALKKAHH